MNHGDFSIIITKKGKAIACVTNNGKFLNNSDVKKVNKKKK